MISFSFFVLLVAPEISQSPSNAVKVEGKTVVFSCVVAGYPEPDVAWTKNGVKLNASGNARLDVSSNNGNHQLNILKVQKSDAGIYRCEANNSLDNASSSAATLTIHCECKMDFSLKHASIDYLFILVSLLVDHKYLSSLF